MNSTILRLLLFPHKSQQLLPMAKSEKCAFHLYRALLGLAHLDETAFPELGISLKILGFIAWISVVRLKDIFILFRAAFLMNRMCEKKAPKLYYQLRDILLVNLG